MSAIDYVPARLRSLPIGVHLECKVHFRKPDGEYALLCEGQTITQELIDRFKRVIFPETKVYISRKFVVSDFFDKGHSLGFVEEDIQAIRNHENPWEKKRSFNPTVAPGLDLTPPKKTPKSDKASVLPTEKPKPPKKKELTKEEKAALELKKLKEVIKIYDKTKVITKEMIDMVAETGKIDRKQGEQLTKDIQAQVNQTDPALIVQTINRIRSADEYLHTHCLNVAFLNGLMGKWLNFDPVRQNELVETGLLHDMGKLINLCAIDEMRKTGSMGKTIPDEALQEFIMDNHCQIGYETMKRWEIPDVYCQIARDHNRLEFATEDQALVIVRLANNSSLLLNEEEMVPFLSVTSEVQALDIEETTLLELQKTLGIHKETAA